MNPRATVVRNAYLALLVCVLIGTPVVLAWVVSEVLA